MTVTLDPAKLEAWRSWIGRTEVRREVLCPEALRRYAAAVQADLDVERIAPPLAHWAFFLPIAPTSELEADGHPARGGFLPPVDLPRRMFAAAEIRQPAPLQLGEQAELTATVRDVAHRSARSGDLVLVKVERRLAQGGADVMLERQTVIYRGADGLVTAPAEPVDDVTGVEWTPGPVDLFRFSAVTFNSHRIHYDQAYTTDVEGYPDLVVQGPYTAARLAAVAQRDLRSPLRSFSFRAVAPLFVNRPIWLIADAVGEYRAVRSDGVTAMSARAT